MTRGTPRATIEADNTKRQGVKDMNLKEAFRYQNKLQALMDEAQSLLSRDSNVTKVQNTYLRKKVMAEAEDETTVDVPAT